MFVFVFWQDISRWDVGRVKNMGSIFGSTTGFDALGLYDCNKHFLATGQFWSRNQPFQDEKYGWSELPSCVSTTTATTTTATTTTTTTTATICKNGALMGFEEPQDGAVIGFGVQTIQASESGRITPENCAAECVLYTGGPGKPPCLGFHIDVKNGWTCVLKSCRDCVTSVDNWRKNYNFYSKVATGQGASGPCRKMTTTKTTSTATTTTSTQTSSTATTTTTTTTDVANCVYVFSECTAICEQGAARALTITRQPTPTGKACPDPSAVPNCQPGEGLCPATTTTTTTTSTTSPNCGGAVDNQQICLDLFKPYCGGNKDLRDNCPMLCDACTSSSTTTTATTTTTEYVNTSTTPAPPATTEAESSTTTTTTTTTTATATTTMKVCCDVLTAATTSTTLSTATAASNTTAVPQPTPSSTARLAVISTAATTGAVPTTRGAGSDSSSNSDAAVSDGSIAALVVILVLLLLVLAAIGYVYYQKTLADDDDAPVCPSACEQLISSCLPGRKDETMERDAEEELDEYMAVESAGTPRPTSGLGKQNFSQGFSIKPRSRRGNRQARMSAKNISSPHSPSQQSTKPAHLAALSNPALNNSYVNAEDMSGSGGSPFYASPGLTPARAPQRLVPGGMSALPKRKSFALKGGDDDEPAKPVERSKSFENALDTVSKEPVSYNQYAQAEGDEAMYAEVEDAKPVVRSKSFEDALNTAHDDDAAQGSEYAEATGAERTVELSAAAQMEQQQGNTSV